MKRYFPQFGAAFSLVEVTLALGVAGFCLLAIFGLLPAALNSNQIAIEQTAANAVLASVIADLRATPPTSPPGTAATSKQYAISIPVNGTAATQTLFFNSDHQLAAAATQARYRLTVNFLATPSGGGTKSATGIALKVSWPAPVDPTKATPAGAVQTYAALDRN
jgi:uncharacterized protein (TIGR02598 family)